MSWLVEHDPKLAAVRVSLSGTVSIDDLRKVTEEASGLAQSTGSKRIMVDTSALTASLPVGDIFDMPRFYFELGVDRGNKVAVIMPATPELQRDVRFYETVCQNRGFDVTVFSSSDEAVAWFEK
jgi:hypothetical protein